MKAITMRIQKSSRPLVILLATVVTIITSIVVANATQTITTPNAAFISYNLAAGANSAPITPVTNRSVLVMGFCTTGLEASVGQVSLLHIPSFLIEWIGLESWNGTHCHSGNPHRVDRLKPRGGHRDGQRRHDRCPQSEWRNAGR
jgi:hypothetical protein